MNRKEVQKELNKFGRYVVQQSRSNLTRGKKNASKELYNSIGFDLEVFPNSFSFFFEMEEYGEFQDKGVNGKEKKYNAPFSYTNKRPPAKVFERWIKTKGIKGRDKKTGRFITNKSLSFAIANSVYKKGIKPSLFFTKPFEAAFKRLPDELIEAFGLDLDNILTE